MKEFAALGVAAEDQGAVVILGGVFVEEGFFGEAQEVGQLLDVAFDDGDVGDAAAFCALAAIDGVGDFFGGFAELALDEDAGLHILAKAPVFIALLFAKTLDLHQVGNHSLPGYNHSVPDRLYFSCSLRETGEAQMLYQFGKLLGAFPFSKLAKRGPVMRIYAIELVEPPVFEREFPVGTEVDVMVEAMREFLHADCACEIDTFWDLWQYDGEWKLRPAPLTLACYGPEFESEHGDHLRIEFGLDALFLPIPGIEGSLRMGQSNLRSLLHLVKDLEEALDIESRQVWSESGANFADVLRMALGTYNVN